MLQNLSVQFSSITRGAFFVLLQTETCSLVLGIFRKCGTVFYRVRYGAVRCIHLVIPRQKTISGSAKGDFHRNSVSHNSKLERVCELIPDLTCFCRPGY